MKIFISYRRDDSAYNARHLYEMFEEMYGSERLLYDEILPSPTSNWHEDILNAVMTCDVFVLLVTASNNRSFRIRQAWEMAIQNDKIIVPVILEDMPFPPGLPNYRSFDLQIWSSEVFQNLATHINWLYETNQKRLDLLNMLAEPEATAPSDIVVHTPYNNIPLKVLDFEEFYGQQEEVNTVQKSINQFDLGIAIIYPFRSEDLGTIRAHNFDIYDTSKDVKGVAQQLSVGRYVKMYGNVGYGKSMFLLSSLLETPKISDVNDTLLWLESEHFCDILSEATLKKPILDLMSTFYVACLQLEMAMNDFVKHSKLEIIPALVKWLGDFFEAHSIGNVNSTFSWRTFLALETERILNTSNVKIPVHSYRESKFTYHLLSELLSNSGLHHEINKLQNISLNTFKHPLALTYFGTRYQKLFLASAISPHYWNATVTPHTLQFYRFLRSKSNYSLITNYVASQPENWLLSLDNLQNDRKYLSILTLLKLLQSELRPETCNTIFAILLGITDTLNIRDKNSQTIDSRITEVVIAKNILLNISNEVLNVIRKLFTIEGGSGDRIVYLGDMLNRINDPRPGVGSKWVKVKDIEYNVPDITWCFVPGDESAAIPQATVWHYQISKYPITYEQFQLFGNKHHDDNEKVTRNWNYPIVGISWYGALAYCEWLTVTLRDANMISSSQLVRLPTETEWEYAARGVNNYTFPWGSNWDSSKTNTCSRGIGRVSAVGLFPGGESWVGALDMAGNIWEWTINYEWDKNRVVAKGGAYNSSLSDVKIENRLLENPNRSAPNIGFRCVLVDVPNL